MAPARLRGGYSGVCKYGRPADVDPWAHVDECGELIGRGAFGIVVKAHDVESGEVWAIKSQQDGPLAQTEERVLKQVAGPGVVELKAVGVDDGARSWGSNGARRLLALEAAIGSLDALRDLPEPPQVLAYMHDILTGLETVHAQRVAHRDLKPGNVLIFPRDETAHGRAKLTDFGLACVTGGPTSTASLPRCLSLPLANAPGTEFYKAPEIVCATLPQGSRSDDLWAAGLIFYELVFGQYPRALAKDMRRMMIYGWSATRLCWNIRWWNTQTELAEDNWPESWKEWGKDHPELWARARDLLLRLLSGASKRGTAKTALELLSWP